MVNFILHFLLLAYTMAERLLTLSEACKRLGEEPKDAYQELLEDLALVSSFAGMRREKP